MAGNGNNRDKVHMGLLMKVDVERFYFVDTREEAS